MSRSWSTGYLNRVIRAVQGEVHVEWLDNVSKFNAIAVQGLSGAFKECLWTARGLHRYVGPPVSTALVAGLRGMPQSLFEPTLIDLFKQKMTHADGVSVSYFKDSVCHKFTVRKIPLKPDVDASIDPTLLLCWLLCCGSRAMACGTFSRSAC